MNVYDIALRYLGSRARTCREMELHLKKKGFEEEEITETIAELKAHRYLNDQDYCMEYFSYAEGKGRGYQRIQGELEAKGVKAQVIRMAWEDYEPEYSELERAKLQAEKIIEGDTVDEKLLAKLGRRLNTLGYSADVIYRIVGEYRYMRKRNE